ncbi:hypothetical protein Stok01_02739 [Sulfurisphaera tokodaii]
MNELNRFSCIDYDLVCDEGKKADSVCFYIENCRNVKVYIVEKKATIDLQSSKGMKAFEQIEQTVNNLSSEI